MRLRLLACAETALVDQATNRASVINLLEEVVTPTLPAVIWSVAVFTFWEREAAEADTHADLIVRLNQAPLVQTQLALTFQDKMRCRAVATLFGLPLTEPGTLVFEVLLDNQVVGTWPVPVIAPPQVAEAPPA